MATELIGSTGEVRAAPGETMAFKVSTDLLDYEAAIVRLVHGDRNGPGFKEEVIASAGTHLGRVQSTHPGSFVIVDDSSPLDFAAGFTVHVWIWPTTPDKGNEQGLVARWSSSGGMALLIDRTGEAILRVGDGNSIAELSAGASLRSRQWYSLAASFDPATGRLALRLAPLSRWPIDEISARGADVALRGLGPGGPSLFIGALGARLKADGRLVSHGSYNGKIECPTIYGRAFPVEALAEVASGMELHRAAMTLDFAGAVGTSDVFDLGPAGLHGRTVNMPTRAVTGHSWRGEDFDFKHAPAEYGAIHFHDDDLEDAGWSTDFTWTVPAGARSGFYAARIRRGDMEDHIPFFVRPPRGVTAGSAKALVLAPTFTYLAYACERLKALPMHAAAYSKRPMDKDPLDHILEAHPEWSASLYDVHSDGSGVCHSTWRRPNTSMRPKYRQWQVAAPRHLAADLNLIDWLEAKGVAYDVATDHDLHEDGDVLLDPYKVLLTGTHPEYWSRPMLDAVRAFLDRDGRMMYLGGNGYYWVTAVDRARPYIIEVRRGNSGSRAWNSGPGELYLASTGEMGGLWRYRGQPPHEIAGIGFAAMGYDAPTPGYRREPGSFDPRAAFIFEGIGADEVIGNFGLVLGGAAGDEMDRLNLHLGSPSHALLLGRASGHDPAVIMPVLEDYAENSNIVIAAQAQTVSADIVYFETRNQGAVFSAGAISWCGSLSHNGYDNNVSRITDNVLRRFVE